jgi:hypothetical protein
LKNNKVPASSVSSLGQEVFNTLAHRFPVACSSDEFYYFPHIRLKPYPWHLWDNFTMDSIADIIDNLKNWINQMVSLEVEAENEEDCIDLRMLKRFCLVLQEQLQLVRTWQRQPSFYLLLANTGVAEALATGNRSAAQQRIDGLPAFLEQAKNNLTEVPALFREIGLAMVVDTQVYYTTLQDYLPDIAATMTSLVNFKDYLERMPVNNDMLLPLDVTERIIQYHLDAGQDLSSIDSCLDNEIAAMEKLLFTDNGKKEWPLALARLAIPKIGRDGAIGLYKSEVDRLLDFCLNNELLPPGLNISCPVRISTVPASLRAIRTASSYSIIPEYPPTGGTFSIFDCDTSTDNLREYPMLSAHEIYPGHHLLDASRLNLSRPIRRHIELPLFYEGWACFAEELLWLLEYFSTPEHRLLLVKRRFWRAIRGKIDLGLHTGKLDLISAARLLNKTGRGITDALATVKKYALNPGYQICYTVGLKSFLHLYDQFGRNNVKQFIQTILAQGEIGFADLHDCFMNKDLN